MALKESDIPIKACLAILHNTHTSDNVDSKKENEYRK